MGPFREIFLNPKINPCRWISQHKILVLMLKEASSKVRLCKTILTRSWRVPHRQDHSFREPFCRQRSYFRPTWSHQLMLPSTPSKQPPTLWLRNSMALALHLYKKTWNMEVISRLLIISVVTIGIGPSSADTHSKMINPGSKRCWLLTMNPSLTMTVSPAKLCSKAPSVAMPWHSYRRARCTAGHHSETRKLIGTMLEPLEMVRLSVWTVHIWVTTCQMEKEIDTASTSSQSLVTQLSLLLQLRHQALLQPQLSLKIESKRPIYVAR